MKCELCKEKIETTFLEKLKGTYVKVNKKLYTICNNCQKKFSVKEIREKLS
ncbi:MAG: hypothetical protein AABY32_03500 [Nanoarchaeota archaeon]